MNKKIAAAAVAASALAGGAAGLTLFGPTSVEAANDATTTTTQAASASDAAATGRGPGDHGPGRGRHLSAVAKALGVSESDLREALESGKTIAEVAKAEGVAVQKVIDALVADGKARLAEDVKSGRLTQAEADERQAKLVEHVTDLVNGEFKGGDHGPGPGPGRHLSAVAKALGVSESDLREALESGKTIAEVAKAEGVAVQKVIDALVADGKARLAEDVKSGRLTQAEADERQAKLVEHVTDLVNGEFKGGDHGPGPGPGRHLSAVAKALGVSESDLREALESGKTIAEVAKAEGVAVQKVIDALVADGKARLAEDVKSGRLTQAEADERQAKLVEHVTDLVNGEFRGGDHGPGPGPGFGRRPN